jgi:hypothetical protein
MVLGSGIRKKPIPDPGVKKHPIPDPGSRIRIRNTAHKYRKSKEFSCFEMLMDFPVACASFMEV